MRPESFWDEAAARTHLSFQIEKLTKMSKSARNFHEHSHSGRKFPGAHIVLRREALRAELLVLCRSPKTDQRSLTQIYLLLD